MCLLPKNNRLPHVFLNNFHPRTWRVREVVVIEIEVFSFTAITVRFSFAHWCQWNKRGINVTILIKWLCVNIIVRDGALPTQLVIVLSVLKLRLATWGTRNSNCTWVIRRFWPIGWRCWGYGLTSTCCSLDVFEVNFRVFTQIDNGSSIGPRKFQSSQTSRWTWQVQEYPNILWQFE